MSFTLDQAEKVIRAVATAHIAALNHQKLRYASLSQTIIRARLSSFSASVY